MDVANLSRGSSTNPGDTVQAAFDNAYAAGLLIVTSAGNSGNPKGKGKNIGYPARYASTIAVTATTISDSRASFSSTGEEAEMAAPGAAVRSTVLGGGYEDWNGTSMASPHVTGAAALVIAAGVTDGNEDGNINDEVRQLLTSTAIDLGDSGRDIHFGYGLVDVPSAIAAVNQNATPDPTPTPSPTPTLTPTPTPGPTPTPTPTPVPPTPTQTPEPSAIVVDVSTDQSEYSKGDQALIYVDVTDADGPVAGAAASVLITTKKGNKLSANATTGSNGRATFSYRVNPGRDGRGEYSADGSASFAGFGDTETVTFTVN
jgi:hypothetical protein